LLHATNDRKFGVALLILLKKTRDLIG